MHTWNELPGELPKSTPAGHINDLLAILEGTISLLDNATVLDPDFLEGLVEEQGAAANEALKKAS